MSKIHSTAIVEKSCTIGKNVTIGAYTVIEGNVKIDDDNIIFPSVYIGGNTDIGKSNKIFSFSSIGAVPQDLKFNNEKSKLRIGNKNTIREHCTFNLGTKGGGMLTEVGDNSLFMAGVHIAHDCIIKNNTILANQVALGGHVTIDDKAVLGGLSAVHQFCRIGSLAMIGGMTAIENDIIPYGLAMGNRAKITGINLVGLRRANYKNEDILEFKNVVEKLLSKKDRVSITEYKNSKNNHLINTLLDFINKDSTRGLCLYGD
tara:strand:+ start:2416 stop:3195 length:780 start_codon:yes stop_codon:yes gene_type:complete